MRLEELEELEEHVTDQTLKINELINSPNLFSNFVGYIERFRLGGMHGNRALGAAGGVGGTERGRGRGRGRWQTPSRCCPPTQPVVKFPETLPDAWSFDSLHALVRSEYMEAEAAALAANARGNDAFLVAGQSGIGSPLSFSTPSPNPDP